MVSAFPRSLAFWTGMLGFTTAFLRPAQSLACLTRPEGAQVMIYQRDSDWQTRPMDPPFGRGLVTQIFVADVQAVHATVTSAGLPLYVPLHEKWRDWGEVEGGQREFLLQDPDGDLIMVAQRIGTRPLL